HFKYIYKPTNNNLETSSNTRNKNVDTSPRTGNDIKTRQYVNQVVQQSGILFENQEERGLPLSVEKDEWLHETDEEPDEQELEAHYMYMEKIQEVLTADSRPTYDAKPLEQVQSNDDYNVFVTKRQHSDQPETINDTYVVKTTNSNVIPNSSDMCDNEGKADQNAKDYEDERVVLANLIENLKLDTDENKKIQKQLKKANAALTHELNQCKSALGESNDI
ncbi:hypothetical protein Tco_0985436, partial [Tanacetum coccineum]